MELLAQAVIQGASYAKDHGYYTSYEEAKGIIMRRSMMTMVKKFPRVEDKEELRKIHNMYQQALAIPEKDLVNAARDIITFQKMCTDVDTSILLDKMTIKKMYNKDVENILVKMVHDHPNLLIKSVDDALELQCYLESVGKVEQFITPPQAVYEEKDIYAKAPVLCTKKYVLKVASRSKEQVAGSLLLKNVWDFQVSDKGWALLEKKFSFGEVKPSE